jgi:hypothetical protein
MPPLVRPFLLLDVALGLAYLANALAGAPFRPLTVLLDLNGEGNVPAWYASMQWVCVAALLGLFAARHVSRAQRESWLLVLFPLVFLVLSLDEAVQLHERLGRGSDRFVLPGGSRENTVFARTGLWMAIIGPPFLAFFVGLLFALRPYFQRAPGAFLKILWGMALMLTGALGLETFSNFVAVDSAPGVLQIFCEEMCEMVGSTVVLWGSYELLCQQGVTVRFGTGDAGSSVEGQESCSGAHESQSES